MHALDFNMIRSKLLSCLICIQIKINSESLIECFSFIIMFRDATIGGGYPGQLPPPPQHHFCPIRAPPPQISGKLCFVIKRNNLPYTLIHN